MAEDNFIGIIPQTVFLLEDKIDFCYERTLKYKISDGIRKTDYN